MKLKVPTKLSLCGHEINIAYSDATPDLHGEYCEDTNTITVCTTNHGTKEEIYSTIIHECLHAAFRRSGLNCTLDDISESFEETLIRAIENNMRSMLTLDSRAWVESRLVTFRLTEASNGASGKPAKSR